MWKIAGGILIALVIVAAVPLLVLVGLARPAWLGVAAVIGIAILVGNWSGKRPT